LSGGDSEVRRLAALRPSDHRNPPPQPLYDLVVVGAGPAGLVCAFGGAALGARVALVERHLLGGDCTNVGCVPSKAYLRSGRAAAEIASAGERGIAVPKGAHVEFRAVVERMRRLRAGIAQHDSAERLRGQGIDVFFGEGRFTRGDTFKIGDARLRFLRAVLATGSRPAVPPIAGLRDAGFLTNETIFDRDELPLRLVILGGGPIGCELSQAFTRFGGRVELVERGAQLLPRDDPDAAAVIRRSLERDGVRVHTGVEAARVRREQHEVVVALAGGAELRADTILVAVGREPNTHDLGLEAAGVAVDGKTRRVEVDRCFRTTNPRIYAAGDVASAMAFTHAADAMARVALRNAFFPGSAGIREDRIPWCTYTDPEVAHVGIDPRPGAEPDRVTTVTIDLGDVDRAVLDDAEGFVRLRLAGRSDRILGATIVAPHAGELIGEVVLAMENGLGLDRLGAAVRPYPTLSEAFRRAADRRRRKRLTPRVQGLLGTWFAVRRRFARSRRD
jgi:pyruvate/2-oxoglutarate dehydrogenase complex dihydrolipoamide dehydrogenase (E3) component